MTEVSTAETWPAAMLHFW